MTKLPPFESDPMDHYSKPLRSKHTKLAKLFRLSVREKVEKPGRALTVVWDVREPLIPGFENNYSYVVMFTAVGNHAGNHYHTRKEELFYPITGSFRILLEDVKNGDKDEVLLDCSNHQVLYIPTMIAHVVIAESNPAILLVIATYPNNEEDEFSYIVK